MAKVALFIVTVLMVLVMAASARADKPSKALVDALILQETHPWVLKHPGKTPDDAVGDLHLTNKAYGCLQIRKPCVDDYNRWYGTKYKAEDCLGNRALSVMICTAYIDRYATAKRIGRQPTIEDMARIWNGGPNGWRKDSTNQYWLGVKDYLGL